MVSFMFFIGLSSFAHSCFLDFGLDVVMATKNFCGLFFMSSVEYFSLML